MRDTTLEKTIRDRAKRGEIVSQKKMRRDTMLEKKLSEIEPNEER